MEFEKHLRVRREKFGAVVFETLREKVFVTNETGGEILGLLEKGKEIEDVIADLANDYDCGPGVIEGDVKEFISKLKDNGLIKQEEQG